jgi:hypothetical protein
VQEKGKGGSSEEKSRKAVLGIRIRMFFGLPDPDPLVPFLIKLVKSELK